MAKKKPSAKPLDLTTQVLIDISETPQDLHEGDALIRRLVDARFELVNRRLDALEHRAS